jgi:hypothetical protein
MPDHVLMETFRLEEVNGKTRVTEQSVYQSVADRTACCHRHGGRRVEMCSDWKSCWSAWPPREIDFYMERVAMRKLVVTEFVSLDA